MSYNISFKNSKNAKEFLQHPLIWIIVKVIAGVVMLIIAHLLGTYFKNRLVKINEERKNETVALLAIAKVVYFTTLTIASLLILRLYGMEIASIIAILSATAFVVGMSLQGTLSDVASGFMLALFQTYNIGDIIGIQDYNADEKVMVGQVKEFRLVNTIMEDMYTGVRVTIPNRKIQESIVFNYSSTKQHMAITDILLSNTNKDFQKIVEIIMQDLKNPVKYPDIIRNMSPVSNTTDPYRKHLDEPRVFVYDMSQVGTKIRISSPIQPIEIAQKKANINTSLRQLLSDNKVILVDPF